MKSYYSLTANVSYTTGGGADGVVDFLDAVDDHLADLGVDDVAIIADEDKSVFCISFLVEMEGSASDDEPIMSVAMSKGMSTLRTAFHACNAGTPGWPDAHEARMIVQIEPVTVSGSLMPPKLHLAPAMA